MVGAGDGDGAGVVGGGVRVGFGAGEGAGGAGLAGPAEVAGPGAAGDVTAADGLAFGLCLACALARWVAEADGEAAGVTRGTLVPAASAVARVAVRANMVEKPTAAIALSCVARQVSRESLRRP